jgi:Arc/MetJ-type ribon-helix-helix transcriptional regulator
MTDTEKITLNISPVDLGRIDLLVEEGFYSTRSDFIRTAIRNQIDQHSEQVDHCVTRRAMVLGVCSYNQRELGKYLENGEHLSIQVVGVMRLADDVTPDMALKVIDEIKVLGSFQAPPKVRSALAEAGRVID